MKVVGKKILVHQAKAKDVSEGGIVLPGEQAPLPYGTIVQISPELDDFTGEVGEVVLFNEIGAISLGYVKEDHVLIEPEDILAILEKGDY
jgi:co-chaperonin GroES (HSP10)